MPHYFILLYILTLCAEAYFKEGKSEFPWAALDDKLISKGVTLLGWPPNAPPPGQGGSVQRVRVTYLRTILHTLIADYRNDSPPETRIRFAPWTKGLHHFLSYILYANFSNRSDEHRTGI